VQTRLDERVIEDRVLFATGHKSEASQVSEPQQSALLWKLVCGKIPADGGEALAQFGSVATVAFVPKTAEPTFNCGPG